MDTVMDIKIKVLYPEKKCYSAIGKDSRSNGQYLLSNTYRSSVSQYGVVMVTVPNGVLLLSIASSLNILTQFQQILW